MANKYYTPDGFTEQFPGICGFKRELESKLRNLFLLNGYEEIETPGVEYFDVYKEFVKEEELYKFTDSTGRLLCNRYDGTIPAVRFCAGRNESYPVRYSYIENMYRSGKSGGGKSYMCIKEVVELMEQHYKGISALRAWTDKTELSAGVFCESIEGDTGGRKENYLWDNGGKG